MYFYNYLTLEGGKYEVIVNNINYFSLLKLKIKWKILQLFNLRLIIIYQHICLLLKYLIYLQFHQINIQILDAKLIISKLYISKFKNSF